MFASLLSAVRIDYSPLAVAALKDYCEENNLNLKKEVGILPELDDYDWKNAFEYACKPDECPVGHKMDTSGFTREDVMRIIYKKEGANEAEDWEIVCQLWDGRFAYLRAGCDYTGWD